MAEIERHLAETHFCWIGGFDEVSPFYYRIQSPVTTSVAVPPTTTAAMAGGLLGHIDIRLPFFVAAGFYKPHCPWVTPKKYFDLYPMDPISLPRITPQTPDDYPKPALASTRPWPYFGVTPDQARECKRAYYAAISFVDAQIGKVLDAVDRLGLRDNTIIVFWSDHGYHLGEHGLAEAPDTAHDLPRMARVRLADGNDHQIVKDAFGGHGHIHDFGEGLPVWFL